MKKQVPMIKIGYLFFYSYALVSTGREQASQSNMHALQSNSMPKVHLALAVKSSDPIQSDPLAGLYY
jgi:hypothetical protein